MEGSESEAIFEAFDLNPQRFINEVLNSVDDIIDGAFEFSLQEAKSAVDGKGSDKTNELERGVTYIHNLTKSVIDKRMDMWEKYCLLHCFTVPDGFVLPQNKEMSVAVPESELFDPELDSQLDTLREKLTAAGKENEDLRRKIQLLEKQKDCSSSYTAAVSEVQQLFQEHSVHHMFEEIGKAASELHRKITKLKASKTDEVNLTGIEKIQYSCGENIMHDNLVTASLEDIQEFANLLKGGT